MARVCDNCNEKNDPTEYEVFDTHSKNVAGPETIPSGPVMTLDYCAPCLKALSESDWRELQRRKPRIRAKAKPAPKTRRRGPKPAPSASKPDDDPESGAGAGVPPTPTIPNEHGEPVEVPYLPGARDGLGESEQIPVGTEHAEYADPLVEADDVQLPSADDYSEPPF